MFIYLYLHSNQSFVSSMFFYQPIIFGVTYFKNQVFLVIKVSWYNDFHNYRLKLYWLIKIPAVYETAGLGNECKFKFQNTLKAAFKKHNYEILEKKVASFKSTEIDTKTPLDQAFREVLLHLLSEEADVTVLRTFIEFSIEACRKHLTTPTMPVVLLGKRYLINLISDFNVTLHSTYIECVNWYF